MRDVSLTEISWMLEANITGVPGSWLWMTTAMDYIYFQIFIHSNVFPIFLLVSEKKGYRVLQAISLLICLPVTLILIAFECVDQSWLNLKKELKPQRQLHFFELQKKQLLFCLFFRLFLDINLMIHQRSVDSFFFLFSSHEGNSSLGRFLLRSQLMKNESYGKQSISSQCIFFHMNSKSILCALGNLKNTNQINA